MCTQMGSLPFYIYSYTPLNFANFDLNFKIVFEPHVHTNGKPAFSCILVYLPGLRIQTSCGRFCILADLCVGRISRTKRKKRKQASHLLIRV